MNITQRKSDVLKTRFLELSRSDAIPTEIQSLAVMKILYIYIYIKIISFVKQGGVPKDGRTYLKKVSCSTVR